VHAKPRQLWVERSIADALLEISCLTLPLSPISSFSAGKYCTSITIFARPAMEAESLA